MGFHVMVLSLMLVVALAEPPVAEPDEDSSAPATVLSPETRDPPSAKDLALQNCVTDQERAAFCPDGTAWSAGPCAGGEYLVCEKTNGPPNILSTALTGVTVLGFALPSLILAAGVALFIGSLGALIYSTNSTLTDPEATRWRTGSVALSVLGALTLGTAASVLVVGVLGFMWLGRQGLEVVEADVGTRKTRGNKRYILYVTTGTGRSSPLAAFRSTPEDDCHSEIQRLATEDHFFKVAEIWSQRNRPLLASLDPWRSLPRLPERTPASQRMDLKKCQAQLDAGAERIRRASEDAARAREELKRVQEQSRSDLLECARKSSVCTCNCSAAGGTGLGGLGGSVELGPAGTPAEFKARLASAFAPNTEVTEDKTGTLQVNLLEVILFETDKDTLTPAAWSVLSKAAQVLVANPSIHILIEGHASAPGSVDYNQDLSNRRAQSVLNALINLGVNKNRVGVLAHGKNRPAVRTDKEEQKNRRVIIRLVHESDVPAALPAAPRGKPPAPQPAQVPPEY
jgi:outer membrane protein OmpA-like peptidoglycan-associated protein